MGTLIYASEYSSCTFRANYSIEASKHRNFFRKQRATGGNSFF